MADLHSKCISICVLLGEGGCVMPGLCLTGGSPAIQGSSHLRETLSGIHGQKSAAQPQQTTRSQPHRRRETERERERESEHGRGEYEE